MVTRFMPSMREAISAASSGEWASLTPPALPRPPAWICAFDHDDVRFEPLRTFASFFFGEGDFAARVW